jgi:hypothetical protein
MALHERGEAPAPASTRDRPAAPQPAAGAGILALQQSAGNRAVAGLLHRTVVPRAEPVPPGLIQRSTDDVLEALGDFVGELLSEYKVEIGQLREVIEKLGLDKVEKGKLPKQGGLYMRIGSALEQETAPKSAYTGKAYSDPGYLRKRDAVKADLDLDTGYKGLGAAEQIEKLFGLFCKRRFTYSMAAGGFDRFAANNGDCKTLTESFMKIVEQEFGVTMTLGSETTRFLTAGGATIDPQAVGNCDKGTRWFFNNHYWVEYAGTQYDVLFCRKGINRTTYDLVKSTGKLKEAGGREADREYWLTASGTIVWENIPTATGPNPQKYRSDVTPTYELLKEAGFQDPR